MRPPKILFVVTEDWYLLSHRLTLAQTARDAGYSVGVVAAPGRRLQDIEAQGFSFHPWRLTRGSVNPFKEWAALQDLKRIFRAEQPDLVHLVAVKPVLYGTIAARATKVPGVICAVAGLGYVFMPGGPGRTLLRALVSCGYRRNVCGREGVRVILQNPDDKALFLERGFVREDQVRIICGNGLDLRRFSPQPEPELEPGDAPVVLMHSRMLWDKGAGDLAEASALLKERGVQARLTLVGDPDPSNPASVPATTLAEWNAQGTVTWLPHQQDVSGLLASCHVACLPSYREGAPQSLMEAAACGRPIVTTDVPGCREIVIQGKNGFLVPPRDPVALADALEKLLKDADLRQRMGIRSRELALERFDREIIARQTLAVYQELLDQTRNPEGDA